MDRYEDLTKKSYPRGKAIVPAEFWIRFPLVSEEILEQPSMFGDPEGFLRYLPDVISDRPEAWAIEAPLYEDRVYSPQRCSFSMYECVLC